MCCVLGHSVVSCSLRSYQLQSARLLCPWDSLRKNTEVGCHALLQRIFPTQGSNPGLPPCRQILYHLSHQGSPWIPECIAYPFSRQSSQPRNRTGVSCIAGGFFTSWATREALDCRFVGLFLGSLFYFIDPNVCFHTTSLSIHPSLDTGSFHVLAIVNNSAMNVRVVQIRLSFYLP